MIVEVRGRAAEYDRLLGEFESSSNPAQVQCSMSTFSLNLQLDDMITKRPLPLTMAIFTCPGQGGGTLRHDTTCGLWIVIGTLVILPVRSSVHYNWFDSRFKFRSSLRFSFILRASSLCWLQMLPTQALQSPPDHRPVLVQRQTRQLFPVEGGDLLHILRFYLWELKKSPSAQHLLLDTFDARLKFLYGVLRSCSAPPNSHPWRSPIQE